jgi:hypothetical protein
MHDSQILALENEREFGKERENASLLARGRASRIERDDAATLVEAVVVAEKPSVALLLVARKQIQLVIPGDTLGSAGLDEVGDELDNGDGVGATIHEVADEDQWSRGATSLEADAEALQQPFECADLAVDISDDIERAFRKRLGQARHETP